MTETPDVPASPGVRPEASGLLGSGIVEVFEYGRGRPGLVPLWVGEGDEPTSAAVCNAISASLAAGETIYGPQRGLPELRAAIATYMTTHYGGVDGCNTTAFEPGRFSVTIGGMHALMTALRLVAGAGDEVIVPSPTWPNFIGAVASAGARVVGTPLRFELDGNGWRWRLDLDAIARAVTGRTRAIVINTPANPTGWTATRDELAAILDLARRRGLWIIADEIYGRIVYEGGRAPSFHDVMARDDRILFAQTFSKNWAMTGLRVGWLEGPADLGATIENVIHYSSSGTAMAIQRGALAALATGEADFARLRQRLAANRSLIGDALTSTGRVRFAMPEGAFYLFCAVDGFDDTRALAFRLVDEIGVGVAPGTAFGSGGEGFLRLCLARRSDELAVACDRLVDWLKRS